MNENNQSFFDSKTILAVLLVGASWLGWQWYMQNKYPEAYKPKEAAVSENKVKQAESLNGEKAAVSQAGDDSTVVEPSSAAKKDEIGERVASPESLVTYEDELWSFALSSKGMGVKNLRLKQFSDREGNPIHFGLAEGFLPLETNLVGRRTPLDFTIEQVGPKQFVGKAQVGGLEITKTMTVVSEDYSLDTQVSVQGSGDFAGVNTYISDEKAHIEKGSFFMPQFAVQEFFVSHSGGSEDRVLIDEDADVSQTFPRTHVFSIGTQYFAQAIVDRSDVLPEAKTLFDNSSDTAIGVLSYPVLNRTNEYNLKFTGYLGPKSLNLLKSIDEDLAGVIDFGMFSWIARYILQLMKWFYSLVGNWGVAIILLTIVVRILVLPFTVMSYKSMKSMQVIQPQIKSLREKYKDDQQKLNQEMMQLMRTHKVNPLGGCLPVLLQFPIFIALYQVLGQSVELYKAPFYFWINDLSIKDPFYVLPVLMGITMFLQMRIQPSTLEPAQARIMMIMPVVFAFFMISLPSGVTLYIFVSALFAVIQQLYFLKDKKAQTSVAEA